MHIVLTRTKVSIFADMAQPMIWKAVTASSRLLRALRPLYNRQLTVLVNALPASHMEEDNRPGAP